MNSIDETKQFAVGILHVPLSSVGVRFMWLVIVLFAVAIFGGMIAATPAAAQAPEPDTWTDVGSLNEARAQHAAALLNDGRVLIAGGTGVEFRRPYYWRIVLSNAELYDSGTGQWTTTGSLSTPRVAGTATTLDDGRILVAGGRDKNSRLSGAELSSTEIFDPVTETWSAGASMAEPRSEHLAVRLDDGRVLVAGQRNDSVSDYPPTAEIYDPVLDQWTATGSIGVTSGCCDLQGILLPDGRVLTTLGTWDMETDQPGGPTIYDPATNSWSQLPPAPSVEFPNGPLFMGVGPRMALLHSGNVIFADGQHSNAFSPTNIVAELDPIAETWTQRPKTRFGYQEVWHRLVTLPDGRVLAIGGLDEIPGSTDEMYDPATAETEAFWNLLPEGQTRVLATVTVLDDGRPLIVGGRLGWTTLPINTAAVFTP